VFLATRVADGGKVAIKVMNPELAVTLARQRFEREIRICTELEHPNVVPIVDAPPSSGLLYYVMPFVEGESLRELLNQVPQLPIERAVRIARDVCDALTYAHERHVIHRDIKPENILLPQDRAVVTDFGLARAISAAGGDTITEPGFTMGTPYYMSPEQSRGALRLDGRTDVYSLGCVLYEMLTGQPPFQGRTVSEVLLRRMRERPPRVRPIRPDIPRALEKVVLKSLATKPHRRPTSASLGKSLDQVQPA